MRSIGILLIIVATITFTHSLSAQQKWSLKQCIDYAVENNIDLQRKQIEHEDSKIELNNSKLSRLPDLSAGASQNLYFGRGPSRDGTYKDQSQTSTSFNAGTNVPIFNGFRITNEVKANILNLRAKKEEINKSKEDISIQVATYYLQVLFNKEILNICEKQLELSTLQLKKTEVLVKEGKSAESALYESRSIVANDEVSIVDAKNNLTLSLLDLSQLLNLEDNKEFDITMPSVDSMLLAATLPQTPTEIYNYSLKNRPTVKVAEYSLANSKQREKIARSAYYPTLNIGANYSSGYYHTFNMESGFKNIAFFEQLRNNGSESIGLSLSIPIFNRMATRNSVKRAILSTSSQELMLQSVKQQLYKEIEQAHQKVIAAQVKSAASTKAVESAKVAFDYEEKRYNTGKSTVFEYNEAKTRYIKSLSELAQAQYEYIFKTKILNFYSGKPLY